ncbi:ABC transporter permease [Micromonospora sp. NPDC050417]|uniref:ABC transporter permease n=1 Tax=Micromonospora sp. NPDC050417 TaxID=3364280 RepID=UPI0037B542D6
MTAPTSSHPRSVEDVMPDARALVLKLGGLPSRNKVKTTLRVGGPKADEVLARLREDAAGPVDPWAFADPEPATVPRGAFRLSHPGQSTEPDETEVSTVAHLSESGHLPTGTIVPVATASDDAVAQPAGTRLVDRLRAALDRVRDRGPEVSTSTQFDQPEPLVAVGVDPVVPAGSEQVRALAVWPIVLLAMPAFVAIWSGWVGLGGLTGFGVVRPLPGIWDSLSLDTAITLPIGVEAYGAYAMYVWLSTRAPVRARKFAAWSAVISLLVGAAGQVAYHLLVANGITAAPWPITVAVACLPVVTFGLGCTLAHLVRVK